MSIFTSTQPAHGSGSGSSRSSYLPGSTSVAASTFMQGYFSDLWLETAMKDSLTWRCRRRTIGMNWAVSPSLWVSRTKAGFPQSVFLAIQTYVDEVSQWCGLLAFV